MSEPIGVVSHSDARYLVTLRGVDDWSVLLDGKPDDDAADILRRYYADTYGGPQDGRYGQWILNDLARRTGGLVKFGDAAPSAPGEIP